MGYILNFIASFEIILNSTAKMAVVTPCITTVVGAVITQAFINILWQTDFSLLCIDSSNSAFLVSFAPACCSQAERIPLMALARIHYYTIIYSWFYLPFLRWSLGVHHWLLRIQILIELGLHVHVLSWLLHVEVLLLRLRVEVLCWLLKGGIWLLLGSRVK